MATGSLSRGRTHPLPGLRRIMEERELSSRQVGRLSDVHYATVTRILKGAAANRDTTRRLSRALKVTPEELMAEGTGGQEVEKLERNIEDVKGLYLHNPVGGQAIDPDYEDDLAALYARLAITKGATEKAIKEVALKAIRTGKAKGWADAQEEKEG